MSQEFELATNDPDLKKTIETGFHPSHPQARCVPKTVQQTGENRAVIFSALAPEEFQYPYFAAFFQSLRAISLTATASPYLLVWLWGALLGVEARFDLALLGLLSVLCLHLSINVYNDIEDFWRMIDLPGGHGGSGVLQNGWLSVAQVKRIALGFLILCILLAIPVFLAEPTMATWIGSLGILGALAYSNKPVGLKYRALGDLAVFVLCGPLLTAGASVVIFSKATPWSLGIGFFTGFLACAILHANNTQDIDIDSGRGATTLASLIGFGASRYLLAAFYLAALISIGLTTFYLESPMKLSWSSLPFLIVAALLAARLVKRLFQASGTQSPILNLIRIRAAELHLIFSVCLALAVVAYYFLERSPSS